VERVTGIEPAWPAWKAESSERCLRCSACGPAGVVPSACLSDTRPAGGAVSRCRSVSGRSSDAVPGASGAHAGPEARVPVVLPVRDGLPGRSRETGADGMAHCSCDIFGGFLHGDSASPRSRPRRLGLRRSAACAYRPTVRAGRPGCDRDTLDRVYVDHAAAEHRVLARLETDLADEAADRGGAWCDEHAPVSRDHCVAGEDGDRRRPISAISHHQISLRAGNLVTTVRRLRGTTPDHPTHPVRPGGARRRRCSSPRLRPNGGMPPTRSAPHRSWPPGDVAAAVAATGSLVSGVERLRRPTGRSPSPS